MYGDSWNLSLNSNSCMYVRGFMGILIDSEGVGDRWYDKSACTSSGNDKLVIY